MNNGETSKETIRFVINVARVSGSGLIKGIKIYMRNHEKRHNAPKEGKQTVKEVATTESHDDRRSPSPLIHFRQTVR